MLSNPRARFGQKRDDKPELYPPQPEPVVNYPAEWDEDTFEDPGEDGIYLNQVPQ